MPGKFHNEGKSVAYKPVANVVAGQLVKIGTFVGIADNDIPANTLGSLRVTGVYRVTAVLLADATLGTEMDINFSTQSVVANSSGDADVKVFVAATTSPPAGGAPAQLPVFLNTFGG